MRLPISKNGTSHGRRAFTLLEVLVASTTLLIIVAAMIMSNLFGLAMAARQQIWLGASTDTAQAISIMMADIRQANTLQVGSYNTTNGVFTAAASPGQQSGTALEVFPTTNATSAGPWTIYYYDPVSNNLDITNWGGYTGNFKLVSANPITNDGIHPIFTEVTYLGVPYSNTQVIAPIQVYMSFTKLQNPQIDIESGSSVDFYQLLPIITPRIRL